MRRAGIGRPADKREKPARFPASTRARPMACEMDDGEKQATAADRPDPLFHELEIEDEDAVAASRSLQAAVESALARGGLSEKVKAEICHDAELVASRLQASRNAANRGYVIALAISALFVGLRAGLQTDAVDELRKSLPAEMGRRGGLIGGASRKARRPWVPHATDLAREVCSREPNASNENVADRIWDGWGTPRAELPRQAHLIDVRCGP